MSDVPRVVFYGASGYSNSIVQAHGYPLPFCEPIAYVDDFSGSSGQSLNGIPIISFDEWKERLLDFACFVTIADPRSRRRLAEKIRLVGGTFARLHDRPEFSFPEVSIDAGTFVFPTTYVGPTTKLGKHVQVMTMCAIGHDVIIKDYVTICPSCTVSGYVVIEEEVFVGAGTTIVNGKAGKPLIVGAGTKISAGAVVTKSIPQNTSVAGNPARPLRELARDIRRAKNEV